MTMGFLIQSCSCGCLFLDAIKTSKMAAKMLKKETISYFADNVSLKKSKHCCIIRAWCRLKKFALMCERPYSNTIMHFVLLTCHKHYALKHCKAVIKSNVSTRSWHKNKQTFMSSKFTLPSLEEITSQTD